MLFKQKNKLIDIPNITINNLELERTESIKYLGLMIDENLNWNEHIKHVIKKILK